MSTNNNCLENVLDCGINEIDINNNCYSIQNISSNLTNSNKNNTFYSLNGTDNSGKIGQHISKGHLLGNFDNISSLDCILKCSNDLNCNAIQYNYNDKNEMIAKGYCQLYSDFEIGSGNATPVDNYKCATTYTKDVDNKTINDNFEIINNNSKIQFTKTDQNSNNTSKNIKLISKYQGGLCRKEIDQNSDSLSKNYLSTWCGQHPEIDVCSTFCDGDVNCPSKNITSLVIFAFLTFSSIFFMIVMFGYRDNKALKIVSLVLVIVCLIFLIRSIIHFSQKQYNGSQKDYILPFEENNNCKNCTTLFSKCY